MNKYLKRGTYSRDFCNPLSTTAHGDVKTVMTGCIVCILQNHKSKK